MLLIILLTLMVIFIVTMLYYEYEEQIADLKDRIKKSLIFTEWLILICDMFIGASQGVLTISLTSIGIMFGVEIVDLDFKLSDSDILMSSLKILAFFGIYGIIVSTIFWRLREKIKISKEMK